MRSDNFCAYLLGENHDKPKSLDMVGSGYERVRVIQRVCQGRTGERLWVLMVCNMFQFMSKLSRKGQKINAIGNIKGA